MRDEDELLGRGGRFDICLVNIEREDRGDGDEFGGGAGCDGHEEDDE